jgi:hypothetical protein
MTALSLYKTFVPVRDAFAVDSYHVDVVFADGSRACIDFSDIIGEGPWTRLADPAFFALAHAAYDTVIWTDDVDVAPEDVWERAQAQLQNV